MRGAAHLLLCHICTAAVMRLEPVDTRLVTGVPCVIAPAGAAKQVLMLLRRAGWHPPRHARLMLDRRSREGMRSSARAYQLSDAGALEFEAGPPYATPPAQQLAALLEAEAIEYRSHFQLHVYWMGTGGVDVVDPPQYIRYLPAHTRNRVCTTVSKISGQQAHSPTHQRTPPPTHPTPSNLHGRHCSRWFVIMSGMLG